MDRQIGRLRITFMDGLSAKLSVHGLSLGSHCKRFAGLHTAARSPSGKNHPFTVMFSEAIHVSPGVSRRVSD